MDFLEGDFQGLLLCLQPFDSISAEGKFQTQRWRHISYCSSHQILSYHQTLKVLLTPEDIEYFILQFCRDYHIRETWGNLQLKWRFYE